VDDEPLIGQLLRRVLSPDHDVVYVATVREALERLSSERFDLVLSDLMMPDLTGMDLHAKLQEQMPEQACKMIFLSGGIFTEAAERFLARVPNLCLAKPVEPGVLRKTLREHLDKHRVAG
jgi:CheY-like chemotaxis protein